MVIGGGFLVLVKNDDREKWLSMENLIKWLCKVGEKGLKIIYFW